jgi:DNA processing protein
VKRITRHDKNYPDRLKELPDTPAITVSAPLDFARTRIAIVGSRSPLPESRAYAYALAADLAAAKVIVISGGALGIDRAAHEGALDAGGITWCVAPNGSAHVSPPANADLFDRIRESPPCAMIWPFRDDIECDTRTPRARNAVLIALADAVVVVQARLQSGSRNAASWARSLNRPLWVVSHAPWVRQYDGSLLEIANGARIMRRTEDLLESLGQKALPQVPMKKSYPLPEVLPDGSWSDTEKLVFSVLSDTEAHIDKVASETGLAIPAAVTALLTLSMKNVVVEGPDGFFRRNCAG